MNIEFRPSFSPVEAKNKLKSKLKRNRQYSQSASSSPSLLLKDENQSLFTTDIPSDIGRDLTKELSTYNEEQAEYSNLRARSYSMPDFRLQSKSRNHTHQVSYYDRELLPPLPSDDHKSLEYGSATKDTEDDDQNIYLSRSKNTPNFDFLSEDIIVDRMADKILNVVSVNENSSKHFDWDI